MKKLFTLLLAVLASAGTLFAENGTCGDNLTWDLTDGVLTISGTGEMYNYKSNNNSPWYSYRSSITEVSIENSVTSIGNQAFEGCTSMTSIEIPNNVTSIGEMAFYDCSGLTSVTIGNSVTSIKSYAFTACSGLTSITIPSSVTSIESNAFSRCKGLTSVIIPSSVTSIGNGAFKGCSGLASPVYNTHIFAYMPTSYTGAYTISDGIESIAGSAFIDCSGLAFITIPNSVTSIAQSAFEGCSSLTSVEIPNSVTSIGISAFSSCKGLTSVIIGNGVTSIGGDAFSGCSGLTSIQVSNNNPNYCSVDGILFNKDRTKLISYPAGRQETFYAIPNGVTSIGGFAFSGCSSLTSIEISNSVTNIERCVFSGCKGLTSVIIPSSVTSIWDGAFNYCSNLSTITNKSTIPQNISTLVFGIPLFGGVVDKSTCILYVPAESVEAYKSANVWKDFTNILPIPGTEPACILASGTCGAEGDNLTWELSCDSVLRISGTGAMYDYTDWNSPWRELKDDIKSVVVEEGVTTIGYAAFRDHSHLQQCSLPSTITSIGQEAFCFCFQLMSIEVPDACTSIGSASFNLVPNVVIKDESVLSYNGSARSVNGYVEGYFVYADATKHSLRACSSAASGEIALDDAIERIEYMAFAQCEEITNLQFGSHLQYIGEWSLNGCIGLENLTFQEGLVEIASNAFGNCFGLQTVTLPNSLITVGSFAIGNCPVLRTIHLGTSLTTIGTQFFDTCPMIESIYAPMITPPVLGEGSFGGTDLSSVTCYVPYQSLALYQQAPIWKEMKLEAEDAPTPCILASGTCGDNLTWELNCDSVLTISGEGEMKSKPWLNEYKTQIKTIIVKEGVTGILNWAFYNCSSVTSVTIPNSVTSIDLGVFQGCTSLTSITIPNSITSIGVQAFYNCVGLTSIEIPNSVTSIGTMAFRNCSNITSIIFPSSVTSIGESAFYECSGLTSIEIPNTVENIGDGAFAGCTGLSSINVVEDNPNYCSAEGILFNKDKTMLIQYPGGKTGGYTIPNSVTSIGKNAFNGCSGLSSIEIHNNVVSIGNNAFYGCSGLTSPVYNAHFFAYIPTSYSGAYAIPDGIEFIVGGAFVYCKSLTSITIPNSVTSIGDGAFYDCTNLISITIPNSITSIGDHAFDGCTGLTNITCEAITPPTLAGEVFYNVDKSIPLYVPSESIEAYKAADQWKAFTNILPIPGTETPKYPVIFLDYNSDVLSEQSVEEGNAAVAPEVPEREGYIFKGWNVDIEHIVARTFAIALYDKVGVEVTYKAEDGDVLFSEHADLHFPDAPSITGKTFAGWLTENIDKNGIVLRATYTIDNPTTNDDVTVEPGSTSANVTFPFVTGAITYVLVIRDLFGRVVCKIMFNAYGRLLGIAFAPNRDRSQTSAQTDNFQFTVEGLDPSTTYEYEFIAHDETDDVIETLAGSFTTKAEIPTDLSDVQGDETQCKKVVMNDQVLILRGDKTYTVQGQEVK